MISNEKKEKPEDRKPKKKKDKMVQTPKGNDRKTPVVIKKG